MQTVDFDTELCEPISQPWQGVPAPGEYFPLSQLVQVVLREAEYVPATQFVQKVAIKYAKYVPAVQSVHFVAMSREYAPMLHEIHAVALVATNAYEPAEQLEQTDEPIFENVPPTLQSKHTVAPSLE